MRDFLGMAPLLAAASCTVLVLSACTTARVTVVPELSAGHRKLGRAEGQACSIVVPWAGATQVIPLGVSSRFERAYAAALASVPGASALTDVTMQESWYWAALGTVYCTMFSGEAVQ
jgi:hypothetical protein